MWLASWSVLLAALLSLVQATFTGPIEFGPILAGALGVAATAVVTPAASWVAGRDSLIVRAIKPIQPAIALGLGFALPFACSKLGLGICPAPDALTAAPIGTVLGITLLETMRRVFGQK